MLPFFFPFCVDLQILLIKVVEKSEYAVAEAEVTPIFSRLAWRKQPGLPSHRHSDDVTLDISNLTSRLDNFNCYPA